MRELDLGDVNSSLKLLLVGSEGVGKTTFMRVLCGGEMPLQHRKTIGTEFKERDYVVAETGDEVNLMMWEVGGGQTFVSMSERHYKEANCVVVVFSTTDRASFELVRELHAKVKADCQRGTLVLLVQTKADRIDEAEMTPTEVEALARDLSVRLYRVSGKDPQSINSVIEYAVRRLTSSGSSAALVDIGDVVPAIDNAASPSRSELAGQRSPAGASLGDTSGSKDAASGGGRSAQGHGAGGAGPSGGGTVVFPRDPVLSGSSKKPVSDIVAPFGGAAGRRRADRDGKRRGLPNSEPLAKRTASPGALACKQSKLAFSFTQTAVSRASKAAATRTSPQSRPRPRRPLRQPPRALHRTSTSTV